ncbi:MAG TPA: glycosyltransferase [Chthoniobacterales bacterium]
MKPQRSFPVRLGRELARVPRNIRRLVARLAHQSTKENKTAKGIDRYETWIHEHEPDPAQLDAQRSESVAWHSPPKISLLIPVFETSPKFLDELLRSIAAQTYPNWEARVVDANSTNEALLRHWSSTEPRIRVDRLAVNLGIAENTNRALRAAVGDFIALVDHDDLLAPFALYQLAVAIRVNPEAEIFYSDEDRLTATGTRASPFFKPEWSPELLYSCMYFGHLTAYRRDFAVALGGFRREFDLSQDYDFALRAVERSHRIIHIPHVLYHWREHPISGSSGGKPEARETNIAALAAALQRRGFRAEVLAMPAANRARMAMTAIPLVSVVIPTDSETRAMKCAHHLVGQTDYANSEFILVTRTELIEKLKNAVGFQSNRLRLVGFDEPFNFSRKCNFGAAEATGQRLIFLNDDVEPQDRDWIENVVEPLENPEVGAVAPKLIYEDGRIQHAGLVTGVRDFVGTAFHREPAGTRINANFAQSMRDVSALSGACLALRREDFFQVGGFDETNTPIAHSDVELCFRIRAAGMRCVYTPFTTLKHTGRASADLADAPAKPAFEKATTYLLDRWGEYLTHDPFFPENMRDWLFTDSPVPIRMFARNQSLPTPSQIDILFVSPDLSRSGAPLLLFHLAQWCRANGFFVTVLSPSDGPLREKFVAAEIPLIIDSLSGGSHPSLARLFRNFELVVANTIKTANAVAIAHQAGVPVVWWIHETKLGERFLNKDSRISAALPLASLLIAPSEQSLAVYRGHSSSPAHKLVSGIPDFRLTTKADGKALDRVRFLMPGTIEKRKGQDILIDAIRQMDKALAAQALFTIVGSGTEAEFVARIRQASSEISYLEVAEPVDHEQSLSLLAGADALVCASRDESMPLTILEAMCFGKTIVSTAVGGIPEYLTDRINALLVPSESPAALARALERVVRDRDEANRLGKNARALFETRHTIGELGRNFVGLIEPLVSASRDTKNSR